MNVYGDLLVMDDEGLFSAARGRNLWARFDLGMIVRNVDSYAESLKARAVSSSISSYRSWIRKAFASG